MTNKVLLGATLAAVFTVSMVFTPAFAGVSMEWLNFTSLVKSDDNELKAKINANANIPKDGSGGAFGYGIITLDGDPDVANILVTTTHAGVLDSAEQDDASDAEWHNHYVALRDSQSVGTGFCPGLEVANITWDAPGDVWVNNQMAVFDGPKSFNSDDSLTWEPVSFTANDDIGVTVSFTIDPVDDTGATNTGDIHAVCINEVNFVSPTGTLGKGNAKN